LVKASKSSRCSKFTDIAKFARAFAPRMFFYNYKAIHLAIALCVMVCYSLEINRLIIENRVLGHVIL